MITTCVYEVGGGRVKIAQVPRQSRVPGTREGGNTGLLFMLSCQLLD